MPTNDIKPFAAAGGANVLTQAEYLALAALSTGFSSGKANSKEVNKAIRQATFIASALAQFICDKSGSDVLDDGNVAGLVTNLLSAMNKTSQPLDATLTALAGLVGAANKLPYFNGADTATLTDLTSVGRDIIGKADVAAVLTYLGLGEGSALPVGVPVPWPSATPPTGWIKCNGAPFYAKEYPELAKVYPALKLPDLRGEFIRGWDDGRGVDSGRVVLTGQSQSVQQHTHDLAMAYSSESGYKDRLGAGPNSDMIPIKDMINVTTFTGSGEYYLKANDSTGVETRPRNVAFNYIVRAV